MAIQSVKAIAIGSAVSILGSTISAVIVAFFVAGVSSGPVVFACGLLLEVGAGVTGGFVAGLIARRRELVHAAATGLPCILFGVLLVHPSGSGPYAYPPWYNVAFYALIIPGVLLGGYFARVRLLRSPEGSLLRQLPVDSFLGRLTYGAMLVWGVGETVDSIPSLIGLLGLAFMVYGSVIWSFALLLAIVCSIALMFYGPRVHRRRVLIWYSLLVLVGLATSVGAMPQLTAEVATAAFAVIWLVRTIWYAPPVGRGTSAGVLPG